MLQFITHPSDRFTIAEEVQMAIEGGCRWIQLRMKDVSHEEMRETALEIIPICRENDAFLVIDDNVELTRELGVHGVHLGKHDMAPAEARELLGAEAIIGVTANTAADFVKFRGVDVDYVGLGPYRFTTTKKILAPELGLDGYRRVISDVKEMGIALPIVAIGGITYEDIDGLMATGVNGIAMSGAIINADDPVEYTAKVVAKLDSFRNN